jgi:glycosyltransferase involved in cell wall biosynthesis
MDLTSVGRRALPHWAVNTLGFSDALVFLSKTQGDYFHAEEGVGGRLIATTREVVIPNGITIPDYPTDDDRARAREALGVDEGDFVVGIVARLSPEKAHQVLFKAVARCAASEPRLRMIVIGGGPREDELRELACQLGIDSRTSFFGSRRDVPELLPGFDVACLSSVYEGVPITLVEAMAAGLPVVATDCGSVAATVEDGVQGYVVPVGDVEVFADRLRTLARDPVLRSRLGRSGRARVEAEFPIEATARGYQGLLTELLARRTG